MNRRMALVVAAAAASIPLLAVGGLALAADHARPGTSETTVVGTAGGEAAEPSTGPAMDPTAPARQDDGDREGASVVDEDDDGDDTDGRDCDREADDRAESNSACTPPYGIDDHDDDDGADDD